MKPFIPTPMRTFLLGLFMAALAGCEDYTEFLATKNTAPYLVFAPSVWSTRGGKYSQDTLKVSKNIKQEGLGYYPLRLQLIDNERDVVGVEVIQLQGSGKVLVAGGEDIRLPLTRNLEWAYYPSKVTGRESHQVRVVVSDKRGLMDSIEFTLDVFENLPPVSAPFQVKPARVNSPLEYILDAGASYDPDAAVGGGIASIQWTLTHGTWSTVITDPLLNSITGEFTGDLQTRVIFPVAGEYEIKLSLQDTDGARSVPLLQTMTIN